MTADKVHLNELGEFLKARRADLTPRAIGLPDGRSLRRVPGLRRDEVADRAAISVHYYTRLEQGRVQASASVLAALARALRLDDDQRAYLYELAGKSPARPRRRARQQVRPQLQRILDQLSDTPAIVLGRRMDILGWNSLAAALITDFAQIPERQRNYVRLIFTEPAMRHLYADWETQARLCVAMLRMQAAETPEDPRLAELVGELSVQDPDFRAWWAARHVDSKHFGTKTLRHPKAGDITLDWDTFGCAAEPDQHLIIWIAEPDTPSHQALRFLASWTAEPLPPPTGTTNRPGAIRMTSDELASALNDSREIELTTTGRTSGRPSSRPVWFVQHDGGTALLPVDGSDSQWYKNVLETPSIRLRAAGTEYTATARPITDAADVDDVVERFRHKYGAAAVESLYPKRDVAVAVTAA